MMIQMKKYEDSFIHPVCISGNSSGRSSPVRYHEFLTFFCKRKRKRQNTVSNAFLNFFKRLTSFTIIFSFDILGDSLFCYVSSVFMLPLLCILALVRPDLLPHKSDIGASKRYQHLCRQPYQMRPHQQQALSK